MASMPWYGGQLESEEEEQPNLGQSQQPVEPGTPANVKPGSSISAMLSNPLMQQMMEEIQAGLGAETPADPKIPWHKKLQPGYFTDPSVRAGVRSEAISKSPEHKEFAAQQARLPQTMRTFAEMRRQNAQVLESQSRDKAADARLDRTAQIDANMEMITQAMKLGINPRDEAGAMRQRGDLSEEIAAKQSQQNQVATEMDQAQTRNYEQMTAESEARVGEINQRTDNQIDVEEYRKTWMGVFSKMMEGSQLYFMQLQSPQEISDAIDNLKLQADGMTEALLTQALDASEGEVAPEGEGEAASPHAASLQLLRAEAERRKAVAAEQGQ